ncbi:helix-turn-helix domain-containing protein [Streptomyces sp. NPDC055085]
MTERKPGGRGYGGFHEDATPESIELAKYLRGLVKRAGKTQRDLQEPTGYGKSTISSFLSGEGVPSQAFIRKLVTYVTPPRQEPACMREAMRLYVATQRPQPAPELPLPRTAAEASPSEASIASVAATAQDQAAKAYEQLAQAHDRNQELVEERGRTQQLVLSLSRFTAELQQQVTTLEDQYDEENEENEARLRKLTDQLEAAQRELRRARSSRDETETLLARLRKRSDELEEELAQSRRTVASAEEPSLPPLPDELQEAFFRADFENALRAAEGFLNDGQQRRDAVSDEWSLIKPRQSAMQTLDRLRTGCHLLGRSLGCLSMMSSAALIVAADQANADGWKFLLTLLMLAGIALVSDPWSPLAQLWPVFRSSFRREPVPWQITISTRAMAVRAGRCLSAGLAAIGAATSVECSVQWSAWWLIPLLPATAACAGYAVFGLDQGCPPGAGACRRAGRGLQDSSARPSCTGGRDGNDVAGRRKRPGLARGAAAGGRRITNGWLERERRVDQVGRPGLDPPSGDCGGRGTGEHRAAYGPYVADAKGVALGCCGRHD